MRRHNRVCRQGFTLVEMIVSSGVVLLVMAGVMSAFIMGLRMWHNEAIQSELDFDLQIAMENIRRDMRLSSVGVGLMSFYPPDAVEYNAISIPLSVDTNGDGLLDRDDDGKIVWNKTVVYHVRKASPDQLVRTVFTPRMSNASPTDIFWQLSNAVMTSTQAELGNACLSNETYESRVIFENLVDLMFRPPDSVYDCYSAEIEHGHSYNFGSLVLTGGMHSLTFKVRGKNTNSVGYNVEIDRVTLSASGSPREGETYLPINTHPRYPYYTCSVTGGTLAAVDMSDVSPVWKQRSQLRFLADGEDSALTLRVDNDLWCDNLFDVPNPALRSNCTVKLDYSFTNVAPYVPDIVVSPDRGLAWVPTSAGTNSPTPKRFQNVTAITNIIVGGHPTFYGPSRDGKWARIGFERATGYSFYIYDVKLIDPATGHKADLTFVDGKMDRYYIPATTYKRTTHESTLTNHVIWSDWAESVEIREGQTYWVAFKTKEMSTAELFIYERDLRNALGWTRRDLPPGTFRPTDENRASIWANTEHVTMSIQNGTSAPELVSVHALEVCYPVYSVFRSGIFDTQMAAPVYEKLNWTQVERQIGPTLVGDVDIRIRSSDTVEGMTNASWTEAKGSDDGYFQSNQDNSLASLGHRRYVQYEARLTMDDDYSTRDDLIPKLRDCTINWKGPTGLVDLIVDFGKSPSNAVISATVDGQGFIKGIEVDMEIFKRGFPTWKSVRGVLEVRPLNTGR